MARHFLTGQGGGRILNSYTLAFAILGTGLLLAGILWSIPRLKRRKSVRQFRHDLDHLDVIAAGWSQSLRFGFASDEAPAPLPESRRGRRNRRDNPRAEGEPLV
jgi:hypothetical protein